METDRKAQLWAWAAKQTGIRSGERYVLEKTISVVEPVEGEPLRCEPRARTIAERTNLDERNVRATWGRLVAYGLLTEQPRRGRASAWVFNLGIVVAKKAKAAQRSKGVAGGRDDRPTIHALRAKHPGLAAHTPAETSAPDPGRNIRSTPDAASGGGGRNIRPTPDESSDRSSLEVAVSRNSKQYPPANPHTPGADGERRTAVRGATDYRMACRDDLRGPDGKIRERRPGWYAVTEGQVALLQREYPALEAAVGVKGSLLEAQKHYAEYLEKGVDSDDYLQIPARGALLPRLRNIWLTRDQRRVTAGGKQQPLPTGTEG